MKHPSLRLVRGPIVAFLVLTATTPAGAEDVSAVERLWLWNACEPILSILAPLGDEAAKMGLTREAITTVVNSRLIAARIFTDTLGPGPSGDLNPYLHVSVRTLDEGAVFVDLSFCCKKVFDRIHGKRNSVTWQTRTMGWGDATYILSVVSQLTDEFVDEYLRVNASACQGSGQS